MEIPNYRNRRRSPGLCRTLLRAAGHLAWVVAVGFAHAVHPAQGDDRLVLRLIEDPQVSAHVVRIGDVVEVISGQGDSIRDLLAKPLGPAPRAGRSQVWHRSDILQHLELRGVHPASVRWSGPERVTLTFQSPELQQQALVPAFLSDRAAEQAQQLLARAVRDYLNHQTGKRIEWRVDVEVPEPIISKIQTQRSIVAIGGGQPPWEGEQKLTVKIRDGTSSRIVQVVARVRKPPMVLAAVRPMRRDEIITADDLTFVAMSSSQGEEEAKYFTDAKSLIGKQLRRSISTGLPIQADFVGEPILVQRGNLVQVQAVAGGVMVSTQGKALGAGAAGELVEVEVLATRQRVLGVVVDPLTVRITAQPTRTR